MAVISLAIRALVFGAWFFCSTALASDRQVVIDGGQRLSGVVRASGHDVPLLHALEQILPATYSINAPNAGAWAQAPVSWHAGEPVERVLSEILSVDPALQARVDTDFRLVTITAHARRASADATPPAPALLSSPPPPPSAHAATQALPVTNSPVSPVAVAAPPEPPQQAEWQMRMSDGSVRNALARWASEAGWQFIWDVPTDFEVDATATIHGTLEDALRQVANALAGSQVPIQVVLYKRNRVMRVVPKGAN